MPTLLPTRRSPSGSAPKFFKARRTMEPRIFRADRTSSCPIAWEKRRSRRRTASTSAPSIGPPHGCVSAWSPRTSINRNSIRRTARKIKLGPQVRGGMALNPYSSLTLSADVDVTSNKTLVPGVKSQVLSLGAEQTILTEFLVVPHWRLQEHAGPRHAVHSHGGTRSENFRFSSRLGRWV